ncbi:phage tail protein [Tenacibaculum sp. 190524A05c]|uniref:phage tail protein n=1 Tax=Tenacibaculum platacis TaxID=3137852 RepID=UPI0031FB8462
MNSIKKIIGLLFVCFFLSNAEVKAQDQMLGEVRIFAGNFAPRGWAFCEGQLLAISSHSALFSLLGTMYGGDGRTTFALPDLRGRVAVSAGQTPGFAFYAQGQRGGSEKITLTTAQMPSHNHGITLTGLTGGVDIPVNTVDGEADDNTPGSAVLAVNPDQDNYSNTVTPNAKYGGQTIPVAISGNATISNNGGSQQVNIVQPYLPVRYIIALQGYFPSRS